MRTRANSLIAIAQEIHDHYPEGTSVKRGDKVNVYRLTGPGIQPAIIRININRQA
jgi:hypothetical protein